MNILKIFKIFNKKQKILYDSIYDTLLEKYGKFGEEKKCYENTFLYLESNDLEQTLKIILNSYEGYEVIKLK
jgi:DNA polymerase elongation subunit (family B)